MPGRPREHAGTEAGLARLEGYLSAEAHLREARLQAEAFVLRLPWLTTAQQEEVARRYAEAHVAHATRALKQVARRSAELRDEYSRRYELLRRRLLCVTVASLTGGAALLSGLAAWFLPLR